MIILYFLVLDWEVSITRMFILIVGNAGNRWKIVSYTIYLQHKIETQMKTTHLITVHINSNQKNKFRQEKAAAEVFVNCRSSALNLTEEPECKNAHGEANQRNNYS